MIRFARYAIGFLLLDLAPIHAASIRGQVTSVDLPGGVPGVYVNVYQDTAATRWGATADASGQFLITSLPAGTYQLHFQGLGYQPATRSVVLGADADLLFDLKLIPQAIEVGEVNVTTSIARHEVAVTNTPMRVEVMVPEEVQDKIAVTAGINGALRYSGGIYVNTSKDLYEAEDLRLRGLESRYLLLLGDQVPTLGFQPEEVGFWTLPLVAIKQLEIAKGDYSALYGFGSAGVVNAVLRTPFSDTLKVFGLARSNFVDDHYAGLYAGRQVGRAGFSGILFGERFNRGANQVQRYVITPRLDYKSGGTQAFFSGSALNTSDGENQVLFSRHGASAGVELPVAPHSRLRIQGQFADQERDYLPDPDQISGHSRLSYATAQLIRESGAFNSIAGLDGYFEGWHQTGRDSAGHSRTVWGAGFLQEEWTAGQYWSLVYSGRIARMGQHASGPVAYQDSSATSTRSSFTAEWWGSNQLLALLWKPYYPLSFRLSASYGSAPPGSHYFQRRGNSVHLFVPAKVADLESFRSASFDVKMVHRLFGTYWSGDVSFFATGLKNHPDIYSAPDPGGGLQRRLESRSGYALPGVELFSRLDLGEEAALLFGYTYLDPSRAYEEHPGTMLPLPHNQGNLELDWEIEPTGFRIEVEGKLLGRQILPDNAFRSQAPPYTVCGATLEYALRSVRIFGGIENIFDFRQKDPGPLWGPRAGREVYLGMKGVLQ